MKDGEDLNASGVAYFALFVFGPADALRNKHMLFDRYTKALLALIAVLLAMNVFVSYTHVSCTRPN
jgi:hypothetical protein